MLTKNDSEQSSVWKAVIFTIFIKIYILTNALKKNYYAKMYLFFDNISPGPPECFENCFHV